MIGLLSVVALLLAAHAGAYRPSSAAMRVAFPTAMLPSVIGRAPESARQRASSSLVSRWLGTRPSLLDASFSLLPRVVEEDFAGALDTLNRAVGGLVHLETDGKTKDVKVCFDDMGVYSQIKVSYDDSSGVLTVHGEEADEAGGGVTEATRAVTMPCGVAKPELIRAEAREGRVLVTVPHEAQAPVSHKALQDKQLDVHLLRDGAEYRTIAAGGAAEGEAGGSGRRVEDVLATADE